MSERKGWKLSAGVGAAVGLLSLSPGAFAEGKRAPAASAASAKAQVSALLDAASCSSQARELLNQWGATGDWIKSPFALDGARVFKSPTRKAGTWVVVTFPGNETTEMRRVAPEGATQVAWQTGSCVPRTRNGASFGEIQGPLVTDADLQAEIDRGSSALIYAWSPRMPLSVKGFAEIRSIAEKHGLKLIPVLDPDVNRSSAESAARRARLPENALKKAGSIELIERGMHLHYPSVLVLSKGRFSGLYPGMWASTGAIERFIEEAKR